PPRRARSKARSTITSGVAAVHLRGPDGAGETAALFGAFAVCATAPPGTARPMSGKRRSPPRVRHRRSASTRAGPEARPRARVPVSSLILCPFGRRMDSASPNEPRGELGQWLRPSLRSVHVRPYDRLQVLAVGP